jgi:PTH1 family peptidyl-tRNA hydrolase
MKYLIVGLGNLGEKYELTRHNIGFMVLDQLAQKHEISFQTEKLAEKAEIKHKGRVIHLIKPNTFMNLSGKAVNYWLQNLKITPENLLVIVDDIALPNAKLRLRPKGSAGGHNGLSDIEQVLGNANYARLRFGVGNDFGKGQQAEYVLSNFTEDQQSEVSEAMTKAGEMIVSFCSIGIERTMTQYNE